MSQKVSYLVINNRYKSCICVQILLWFYLHICISWIPYLSSCPSTIDFCSGYSNQFSKQFGNHKSYRNNRLNLHGSCTNCFCPLSFHDETAIMDLERIMLSYKQRSQVLKNMLSESERKKKQHSSSWTHTYPCQGELP